MTFSRLASPQIPPLGVFFGFRDCFLVDTLGGSGGGVDAALEYFSIGAIHWPHGDLSLVAQHSQGDPFLFHIFPIVWVFMAMRWAMSWVGKALIETRKRGGEIYPLMTLAKVSP
jgi:hypothetical protein